MRRHQYFCRLGNVACLSGPLVLLCRDRFFCSIYFFGLPLFYPFSSRALQLDNRGTVAGTRHSYRFRIGMCPIASDRSERFFRSLYNIFCITHYFTLSKTQLTYLWHHQIVHLYLCQPYIVGACLFLLSYVFFSSSCAYTGMGAPVSDDLPHIFLLSFPNFSHYSCSVVHL
jgi:hypothetical protein